MMKTHNVNFAHRSSLLATSFNESENFIFAPYGDSLEEFTLRNCSMLGEFNPSNRFGRKRCPIFSAFGKKCKKQEDFIAVVKEGIKISGGFSVSEVFPSQKWLHGISGLLPMLE
ncbi:hypothetical protein TIFTF001_047959 [Ficus carica]|uniref:Uncharacterized protein n=1 Tax=Ficus carica TaxID=3494 RepID=A0AA88CTN4_FICCA|nr:hypothetical protein TIFTF001_047959 [Ficus carica]